MYINCITLPFSGDFSKLATRLAQTLQMIEYTYYYIIQFIKLILKIKLGRRDEVWIRNQGKKVRVRDLI